MKKLLMIFVCGIIVFATSCTSKTGSNENQPQTPISTPTLENIQVITTENQLSIVLGKDYTIDDLEVDYYFEEGYEYRSLPYIMTLEMNHEDVADDLILFEDFTMKLSLEGVIEKPVFLEFHDGHYLSYNDMTYSLSEMPFDLSLKDEFDESVIVKEKLSFNFFLPLERDTIAYEFWNMNQRDNPSTLVFKDNSDELLSEMRTMYVYHDDQLDAYQTQTSGWFDGPTGYSDFRCVITDENGYEYIYIDEVDNNFEYNTSKNVGVSFNYYLFGDQLSALILDEIENKIPFVETEAGEVYLIPYRYEDDQVIITTANSELDFSEFSYENLIHEDGSYNELLARWIEKGLEISANEVSQNPYCVLLEDDQMNLYQVCPDDK